MHALVHVTSPPVRVARTSVWRTEEPADVVGYSRLMGEDAVGTATLVREQREATARIARAFGRSARQDEGRRSALWSSPP